MECGGKRSAMPLWIESHRDLIYRKRRRASLAAALHKSPWREARTTLQSYWFRRLRICCRHRCDGLAHWHNWFLIGRKWSRLPAWLIRIARRNRLTRYFIRFAVRISWFFIHGLNRKIHRGNASPSLKKRCLLWTLQCFHQGLVKEASLQGVPGLLFIRFPLFTRCLFTRCPLNHRSPARNEVDNQNYQRDQQQ